MIAMPLLVIGVALAFVDIETIVGSGPVMLTYGVILMYLTRRDRQFQWFASACCVFPVLVFLIIFFMLQWSPQDAQHPISILCCVIRRCDVVWLCEKLRPTVPTNRSADVRVIGDRSRPVVTGGAACGIASGRFFHEFAALKGPSNRLFSSRAGRFRLFDWKVWLVRHASARFARLFCSSAKDSHPIR